MHLGPWPFAGLTLLRSGAPPPACRLRPSRGLAERQECGSLVRRVQPINVRPSGVPQQASPQVLFWWRPVVSGGDALGRGPHGARGGGRGRALRGGRLLRGGAAGGPLAPQAPVLPASPGSLPLRVAGGRGRAPRAAPGDPRAGHRRRHGEGLAVRGSRRARPEDPPGAAPGVGLGWAGCAWPAGACPAARCGDEQRPAQRGLSGVGARPAPLQQAAVGLQARSALPPGPARIVATARPGLRCSDRPEGDIASASLTANFHTGSAIPRLRHLFCGLPSVCRDVTPRTAHNISLDSLESTPQNPGYGKRLDVCGPRAVHKVAQPTARHVRENTSVNSKLVSHVVGLQKHTQEDVCLMEAC